MVDELVERIADESGEDADVIKERIEEKMQELSGLVSEEGAAHLIAQEEGVELVEADERELTVENIVPGMNRVDVKVKVVDITEMNTFETDDGEEGKVRNLVLGDSTGTIRMSLWNEQVDVADEVDPGDSIHVQGAYTREDNRGNPELRIGNSTQIEMLDDDIGEVAESSAAGGGSSGGHERVNIREVQDENRNYAVSGTVLEVYTDDPFYSACPECNKKVEQEDGAHVCEEHGEVDRQFNLILSAIIDDGHDNIRTVFFRERAKEFLDAADEEFNGNTELVKEHAEQVKGKDVVVRGRSRYNDFFNRIELIGNEVAFQDTRDMIDAQLAEVDINE